MIDEQTICKLALSLPHVQEQRHWERPAFRVDKKIFATLWPVEQRLVVKLSLTDQTRLIDEDSVTYSAVSNKWGLQGYTNAQYDNLTHDQCYWLLRSSWRLVAPKRLITQLTD